MSATSLLATDFKSQLSTYKQIIDADIAAYSAHAKAATRSQYGTYPADVADVFLDILNRDAKRIRGALTIVGYELCGGTDSTMITRAATAIEMINAYILMVDDIQDRSPLRRGKPSGHELLAQYHRTHHLQGDAAHTGVSLSLMAALGGAHAAMMLLSGLQVAAELRTKAIGIVNQAMLVTAHGQTLDIMNELTAQASEHDVALVMERKTAYYTLLNPLCTGMVLAGAGCEDTDAIRDYALHTGQAFQITDDIIGVFGNEKQSGKATMDDIREGKQTLLTVYALAHASSDDAVYLRSMLGNADLDQHQFARCREIIEVSGARAYARRQAHEHIMAALKALQQTPAHWQPDKVVFLKGLAEALLDRTR